MDERVGSRDETSGADDAAAKRRELTEMAGAATLSALNGRARDLNTLIEINCIRESEGEEGEVREDHVPKERHDENEW